MKKRRTSRFITRGEPIIWLTGGALALATLMILGLLFLVFYQGILTFWPKQLVRIIDRQGRRYLGEVSRRERYYPGQGDRRMEVQEYGGREGSPTLPRPHSSNGVTERILVKIGNYDLYGEDFRWIPLFEIQKKEYPPEAVTLERLEWGPFYGFMEEVRIDGNTVARGPEESWKKFKEFHSPARARYLKIRSIEKKDLGEVNFQLERLRLNLRRAELAYGRNTDPYNQIKAQIEKEESRWTTRYNQLSEEIAQLRRENNRYQILLKEVGGRTKEIKVFEVIRAYHPNQMDFMEKLRVYLSRWGEFLSKEPREANTEGGVFPAIFGTFMMTILMSLAVVPFGVIAALYLKEYAKQGLLISNVRIAVNNLAGVPSIVFGVFGLGFFCYRIGGTIDSIFFPEKLPVPTFGTGGILWASLTLALLTIPVVIVSTEEALAAVPQSVREGSYACGATKWQTIRRIVLPQATPGILTGLILAMARGAGEVAPLMITGVVKLAPELPLDRHFPYFHLERSFMHLGFHIYDVGFQSRNSEAGKPMVFTTTLLLILLIVTLNAAAIYLRNRLRKKYQIGHF
ncbi:MAG TPA: phosphate ABC transporter permease PstA [Candidatus Limnocylindrales bacterium]|nr:phosphate ABC transporter permease PstA [Candidatus Limnocylindrales bacterium]